MTESGIIKVLKLARTAHFQNLSKTALQFILQHTVIGCHFIALVDLCITQLRYPAYRVLAWSNRVYQVITTSYCVYRVQPSNLHQVQRWWSFSEAINLWQAATALWTFRWCRLALKPAWKDVIYILFDILLKWMKNHVWGRGPKEMM